jgi:CheY-like chemotaxis protein
MSDRKLNGDPLIILLVEDNPAHAELVMRALESNRVDNQIHHVIDGEQALDYLHHRGDFAQPGTSPRPQLVLLDLRLPKIDGLEVLKHIKTTEELRSIPTVVLTTSEAERDITKAYDGYANSYLVKPVDFDKFKSLMSDLGFYWLAWNTKAYGDR